MAGQPGRPLDDRLGGRRQPNVARPAVPLRPVGLRRHARAIVRSAARGRYGPNVTRSDAPITPCCRRRPGDARQCRDGRRPPSRPGSTSGRRPTTSAGSRSSGATAARSSTYTRRDRPPRPRRACHGADAVRRRVDHEDGDGVAALRLVERGASGCTSRSSTSSRPSSARRDDARRTPSITSSRTPPASRTTTTTRPRPGTRSSRLGPSPDVPRPRPADMLPLFADLPAVAPPGEGTEYADVELHPRRARLEAAPAGRVGDVAAERCSARPGWPTRRSRRSTTIRRGSPSATS